LEGRCAVEVAVKDGNGDMLSGLLKMGMDPRKKYREGTILEFARSEGSKAANRVLDIWESTKG
jgi:hypothetical protein